jgi:DUF4097 and DUF4098 domain-containing protein YvlB
MPKKGQKMTDEQKENISAGISKSERETRSMRMKKRWDHLKKLALEPRAKTPEQVEEDGQENNNTTE